LSNTAQPTAKSVELVALKLYEITERTMNEGKTKAEKERAENLMIQAIREAGLR